jgi:hypothetical protein
MVYGMPFLPLPDAPADPIHFPVQFILTFGQILLMRYGFRHYAPDLIKTTSEKIPGASTFEHETRTR